MKIIGGIVAYEDGIKTVAGDQFSPTRKVRVELNFSCEDADDADVSLLHAMNKAQSMVHEKLGITAPTAAAKRSTTKKSDTAKPEPGSVAAQHEATVAAIAKSSEATAAVLSDKEKLAAAAGLVATGPGKVEKAKDPAAIEDETTAGDESLDDIMGGGAEATPVTDKDLTEAMKAKNKEINDPVKIRRLIFEFNGGPGHELKDIPAEERTKFLAKLKAFVKE